MKREEAEDLARELRHRTDAGDDERALVEFISNRFRIKKTDARKIFDSYCRGLRRGADDDGGQLSDDPLFEASFRVGRDYYESFIEGQRAKHSRDFYSSIFGFAVVALAIFAFVVYAFLW